MGTTISDNTGTVQPQMTGYNYDQLNRIRAATSYTGISSNAWSNTASGDRYKEEFHYDLNGNIYEANRYDDGGTQFDQLNYHYYYSPTASFDYSTYPVSPTPAGITNRLEHVGDVISGSVLTTDQEPQSANNYEYDPIGNLTADVSEGIGGGGINWTVYGKIKRITRSSGTGENLEFAYDASGNRIEKIVKPQSAGTLTDEVQWTGTYYVRDAQGNVMAVYNRNYVHGAGTHYTDHFALAEHQIYGSSRLGIRTGESTDEIALAFTSSGFTSHKFNTRSYTIPIPGTFSDARVEYFSKLGLKYYELSNHLGNVLVTVSDRKLGIDLENNVTHVATPDGLIDYYLADVLSAQDYYAGGMIMPGRSFNSSSYRFGYNSGSEKDDEIYGVTGSLYTTEFRELDTRLGRWWAIDPETKATPWESPYASMGNNPIQNNDEKGDTPEGDGDGDGDPKCVTCPPKVAKPEPNPAGKDNLSGYAKKPISTVPYNPYSGGIPAASVQADNDSPEMREWKANNANYLANGGTGVGLFEKTWYGVQQVGQAIDKLPATVTLPLYAVGVGELTTAKGFLGVSVPYTLKAPLQVSFLASEKSIATGTFQFSTLAPASLMKTQWFGRTMLQITPEFQAELGALKTATLPMGTKIQLGFTGYQKASTIPGTWLQIYTKQPIKFQ